MDDADGPGTHWCAYFNHPKNEAVYYYDPFGIAPDDRTIKFLKTTNKQIAYNNGQQQKIESNRCGWFCMQFLDNMIKTNDLYDTLYRLSPYPSDRNESLVKGAGVIDTIINSGVLPEMHLPFHSFTGPNTQFTERMAELQAFEKGQITESDCKFRRCSKPLNKIDEFSMAHDKAYNASKDMTIRRRADEKYIRDIENYLKTGNPTTREKIEGLFAKNAINIKKNIS